MYAQFHCIKYQKFYLLYLIYWHQKTRVCTWSSDSGKKYCHFKEYEILLIYFVCLDDDEVVFDDSLEFDEESIFKYM